MGLFSFVKSAGAKLLGADDEKEIQQAEEAAERREAMRKAKMEAVLRGEVERHGLEVDGLGIDCSGDTVTVSGECKSHEDREKVILTVGNFSEVGTVNDQLTVGGASAGPDEAAGEGETVEASPEGTRFYTVTRGDTLSKIAKEHYGNAMKYPVIFEANKPMLSDPDKIYPGQVLRIPALDD